MDSRSIEMRLRLPAPDEPAVLPPLILPAFDGFGRAAPTVSFRRRAASAGNPRLAFAMVLLALAAAALALAGAFRLLYDRTVPVNQLRWPPAQGVLGVQDGFTMDWPGTWHRLAEGGLFQGDFTQTGISYERVALILASTSLPGCASPGASEGPVVVPSGDPSVTIPPRVGDPAVACLRSAPLPSGAVRVTVEVGERTVGVVPPGGPATADTSEPTAALGWTEVVDGQPARLTVISGPDAATVGAAESRVWDVIFPGTIDHVLRVRADMGGSDLVAARAAVQSVIDSIDFATVRTDLDLSSAEPVLVTLIDELDRGARDSRSDFFACFPRKPGTADGTIHAGPGERLVAPVKVSCTTAIAPSAAGLWRITLTTTWPAGDGYAAGGIVQEFFAGGDGVSTGGGSMRPLNDAGTPPEGATVWLPQAPRVPPAPGDGPQGLAAGAFVELLWPGIYPSDTPGTSSSDVTPMVVGWHAYVLDDASMIDGRAWYPVQWDEGAYSTTKWLPASRDGLPTIAEVRPSCPTGEVDLEALTWLTAAERLVCLGGEDVTLAPVTAEATPDAQSGCVGPGPEATSCPVDGSVSWLEADATTLLYGEGGSTGPVPGLAVWADPSAVSGVPLGQWLRVRGHFDDGLSLDCRDRPSGDTVDGEDARRELLLLCRERFVITGFEPVAAP